MRLTGVTIASTIKKAASSQMPHVVDADNDADSARQRLQPTGNVEPVGHGVQVHHINSFQLLRPPAETTVAAFHATAQWKRKHTIGE